MNNALHHALVVGIGNPDRGDDGLGWQVATLCRDEAGTRVVLTDGEPAGLLELLATTESAVLVDAAEFGAPPGTVLRLDAAAGPLPALTSACSSHGLGVSTALALGRALGHLPRRCVLYVVQGQDYEAGRGLSAAVQAALPAVVDCIRAEVACPHA